nr:putative disease resistance protein At3g14460 [Tanacetum cinerariifolium]
MVVVLEKNIIKMERRITPAKRTTTSRKSLDCGKPRHKDKDWRHKKKHGGENSGGNSNQAYHVKSIKKYARVIESFLPLMLLIGGLIQIEGKGNVIIKPTSGNDLVLSNVLDVSNITKNLIYGPILSNKRFKLVIESDKLVITKGGVYAGKGYLDEGLFKLSVVTDNNVINNNNVGTSTAFMYIIDPSFLWHYS